jgi:hypothetical protein
MDGNLGVRPYQVNFEERGAGKVMRVVLYVWDWIPVRGGAGVDSSVTSTGSPTAVLGN